MSRMPRKRDMGTGLGRVRFVLLTQTRLALLSSAQLFDVFFFFINWAKVFDFTI